MKWYHGSPIRQLKEFKIDNPRFQSVEGQGLYLTPDYKIARGYAGSEGSVYEVELQTSAIFDATEKTEFLYCLELVSKKIEFNLMDLDFIELTIESLVSGEYQITDEYNAGFAWQIKNLLLNDERFSSLTDGDEKIEIMQNEIKNYLSKHHIIKYVDKNLGLVKICKDPQVVCISKEIVVGSTEEENYL